jgi:hypothetical protein
MSSPASKYTGPFREGLWPNVDAGWSMVPTAGKVPLVKGYTGKKGDRADRETYRRWYYYFALDNIAIRLPDGYIGFDADLYKLDPTGSRAKLMGQLDLPPTWRSSSRTDGSGISLYRVPPGLVFKANPAPGVEVIQWFHRVVVCWPSIHPLRGEVYRWWWGDDGELLPQGQVPLTDDIVALPEESVRILEKHAPVRRQRQQRDRSESEPFGPVASWWSPVVAATRCKLIVAKAQRAMDAGGSRHDAACSAAASLSRWEAGGYEVASLALEQLGEAFITAVTTVTPGGRTRTLAEAEVEWDDLLTSAQYLARGGSE